MYATTDRRRRGAAARQRGISIIELMVGIVVAMLVSLAAAGSAMVFTASQRQGIGAGGVGVGGGTALAAIKNDVALGGLGFFGDSAYLCNQLDLSVGAGVVVDGTTFVPIQITDEGNDDRIDVLYADRIESGANVLLRSDSDGTSAELQSLLPDAQVGRAVLLTPALAGGTCLVRSITANTASTSTTPQILTFGAAGTHNQAAFTVAPAFVAGDRAALLGALSWNRYRRINNTLVLERPMAGTSAVLARNVVALRMQYGLAAAAANSTTLETWQDATGAFATLDAAELARVRAVRISMVTRSPQRQKPDAAGNCDASLAKPQLFGTDIVPDVADWSCYRFKTTTVVVPMRNLVLGLKV